MCLASKMSLSAAGGGRGIWAGWRVGSKSDALPGR